MPAVTFHSSEEISTEILDQRNYVPEPPESIQGLSDLVWIGDLPHTTSKRSVLNAIRGADGISDISKACMRISLTDGSIKPVAIFSVRFASAESARRFIAFTTRYGVLFQHGDGPVPPGRLIDRPPGATGAAYAYPVKDWRMMFDQLMPTALNVGVGVGVTRIWELDRVPETAVWFILNCIGLRYIIHATYTTSGSKLRVEFASSCVASCVAQRIFFTGIPYLRGHPIPSDGVTDDMRFGNNPVLRYIRDPCNGSLQELREQPYYTPKLSDTEFVEKFNKLPYNIDWRLTYHPFMAHAPVWMRTVDQQFSMLKELDEKYFGGKIWSWEIPEGTRKAVFYLLETQSDPEWRAVWKRFYASTNYRAWNGNRLAWYGEVVLHRKVTGGMCGDSCLYGCNLGRAPIPQVVQDYWNKTPDHTHETSEETESARSPESQPFFYSTLLPLDKFTRYCKVKNEKVLAGGFDSGYSLTEEDMKRVPDAHAPPPLTPHDDESVVSSSGPSTALDVSELFEDVDDGVEIADDGDV